MAAEEYALLIIVQHQGEYVTTATVALQSVAEYVKIITVEAHAAMYALMLEKHATLIFLAAYQSYARLNAEMITPAIIVMAAEGYVVAAQGFVIKVCVVLAFHHLALV
jgi:hypothetical protein